MACAGLGMGVRSCAYLLREYARTRMMAHVLRELGERYGRVEVTDQDGTTWEICLRSRDPE